MNKKSLFILVWAATLFIGISAVPAAADKPNIVIILSDDYGWGSVNCYGAPQALIRTPNLDRLATEGRRFTDANTPSSVCSPTRYALLTGRYCWRTSLKHEVLNPTAPLLIETNRLTISSLLKKHGYRAAAVGKWHHTAPGALKLRQNEFHPQLYNLAKDPVEQNDVLNQNPEVAEQLKALLNRYRDQGWSRPD